MMKDRIFVHFKLVYFVLQHLLLFIFHTYLLHVDIQKKPQKMNNKLASLFAGIGVVGIIFSFFFSAYVSIDLASKGYYTCWTSHLFSRQMNTLYQKRCVSNIHLF
ncbi:DUF1240 domain-containing protein [Providencia hangzhouensis]|uniref:DUF1240 domain-containing protein n=1 Tax=Providencia hangzhouensis TaxID=3031799 RepID=UPI0034DD0A6E